MGSRSDFYVVKYDRLEWIGSVYQKGTPIDIPSDIFIQVNQVMFEEMVIEFLQSRKPYSVIASEHERWPWPWADSRMTDYSYIFGLYPQAIAYDMLEKSCFDPIKIVQGEDFETAKLPIPIKFPIMLKTYRPLEEIAKEYGL